MIGGYFKVKRDMAIVKAGGFFCQACLVGKPAGEQSPDSSDLDDARRYSR